MVCLQGRKQLKVAGAKGYVKWEVGRDEEGKELGLQQGRGCQLVLGKTVINIEAYNRGFVDGP